MSESIFCLLIFGCCVFFLSGSFRGVLGFVLTSTSVCAYLVGKGLTFLGLMLLASMLGLVMLLLLLEHSCINVGVVDDNQSLDLFVFFVLVFEFLFQDCFFFVGNVLETSEILRLSLIFDSVLGLLLLCFLVYLATLCCVHIAVKPSQYNVKGLMDLWTEDFCILAGIASFLCTLPSLIRLGFQSHIGDQSEKNWIEEVHRWSSDVYEVGISMPGTSLPGILFGKNSDQEIGSYRFLPYVFLFLLLDLESSVVVPLLLGTQHAFFPLLFLVFVLYSLSCELTTL